MELIQNFIKMNKKQTALLSVLVLVLIAIGILIFAFAADADGIIGTFVNYGVFLTVVTVLLTLLFSVLFLAISATSRYSKYSTTAKLVLKTTWTALPSPKLLLKS